METESVSPMVEQRLRFIEGEDEMDSEILLKGVAPLRVAAVAVDRPGLNFDNMMEYLVDPFQTLAERLEAAGITDHGPSSPTTSIERSEA